MTSTPTLGHPDKTQTHSSLIEQITLAIDHFNRMSSSQALNRHGRSDDSIRFEVERVVEFDAEVHTRGNLINRLEMIRLEVVLAWKFDDRGKLASIEAYPNRSDAAIPLAATRKPGRRRFPSPEVRDMPERMVRA